MRKKLSFLKDIKPGINKISKYVSGDVGIGNNKVIKLSSNESPFEIPKTIIQSISREIKFSNKYPDGDCSILKHALVKKFGVKKDQIVCGNGSDDILSLICLAFSRENSEIICSNHGFLFYPIISHSSGAKPIFAETRNYSIDILKIIKKINNKTRIIFFANPNNPTGSIIFKKELISALKIIPPHIIVVIDGAYAEYVQEKEFSGGFELVEQFPNLIVTRTFSKIYALAAYRIGWGYSSREVIEILEKIRGPFNVNLVAQLAASKILDETEFLKKSLSHNNKWKKKMQKELRDIGFQIKENYGNFIFVINNFKNFSTKDILDFLGKRNIFVRSLDAYKLSNCFRVSIGNQKENKLFLEEISNFIKKKVK